MNRLSSARKYSGEEGGHKDCIVVVIDENKGLDTWGTMGNVSEVGKKIIDERLIFSST